MVSLILYIPVFLALYVMTSHFLHRIRNLPPSPLLSFPIIGHLYLLIQKPPHRTFARLSDRYGPIFFLQLGSRRVAVVSSPWAAEECLTKNDITFANRPQLASGKIMGYNYTSLAWAPYGDHWRNLRRISSLELLSTHRLQMLSYIRYDEVKLLIKRLLSNEKRHDLIQIFDAKSIFVELTLNIMMRMIAGKRYYHNDEADLEEVKRFREFQSESIRIGRRYNFADYLPFIRLVGGSRALERDMEEVQRKRDLFIQSLIEEHKRKMETDPKLRSASKEGHRKTLIEVLLSLQQTEPEYYKDEIIRGLMLIQILAGTETTATTTEWALSLLLNHPEVLKKAQAEIDGRVGYNRLVEDADLAQLPYLQSIITETLRMYPVVPLLVPHESSEDCSVGGYRVPRGTMLYINVWAIQNDPKVWTDPASFRPERFMGLGGPKGGFKSLPFGSGRRSCPGEGLAIRVVGLTLGSLIQCFEWERPSNEMIDMTEGTGTTMSKAKPLQANCRPRPAVVQLLSDHQIGSDAGC